MDKKVTIAIAVIVAVAVIAVAAFVILNNCDKDYNDKEIGEIGTYVPIYGNATSDLYIDKDDVKMLQSIIDGKTIWDKKKAPYADANQDGRITDADVNIVKKIINREPCEVMYEDYYGDVTKVNFPLTNMNIAVTYYQQAEACAILGVLEKVNVASKAATVYGTLWPCLKNSVEWGTTGSSAITDDAVEKFIANDVKLVVCTPRTENHDLAQRLHEERGINFIQLWYNGNYCLSTIQTMGILMDAEDRSQMYMDYCNNIANKLTSKIKDKSQHKCFVMNGYNETTDSITLMSNERHGSYVLINKYLADAYYEQGTNQFGFTYHNIEWLITNSQKFDSIIFCVSGNSGYSDDQSTGTYYTQDVYNKFFESKVSYFEKCQAYKNGMIIGSVYAQTFGFSAYPVLEIIAAQLYPDLFTLDEAMDDLQEWFDTFGVTKIDVRKNGPISYTGSEYEAAYPQLK